jgi:hypothetical protein
MFFEHGVFEGLELEDVFGSEELEVAVVTS